MGTPRTLVTNDELKGILTAEIHKIEDLRRCYVDRIMPYQQPDEDGCNWSDTVTVSCGGGVSIDAYRQHIQAIVAEARERYNLHGEEDS